MKRGGLLPLLALSACVIGRPVRPGVAESAQGPLAPPVTGAPIVPSVAASGDDPDSPAQNASGKLWVHGYWHWDGVRYSWQRGHWEP